MSIIDSIIRKTALISGLLASTQIWAQPQIQSVLECMHANVPDTAQFQNLQISYVNRLQETSTYELQLFAQHGKGEFEATAIIKKPARLTGGAYLLRSTSENYQVYMYAPSLGQVRRVSGDGITKATLLGTDLGWEDLQIMYNAFMEGSMSLKGEAEVQGRPVYQLQLIPSPKTISVYNRIYLDVDKESCIPLEIRLMAQGDQLHKRFMADANSLIKVEGKYWYASRSQLTDVREGTRTEVTVLTQAEADEKLRARVFNPKSFYNSR